MTPSSLYALDVLCNEKETAPALPSPLFYLISDIPKRVHRTARRAVEYGISEREEGIGAEEGRRCPY